MNMPADDAPMMPERPAWMLPPVYAVAAAALMALLHRLWPLPLLTAPVFTDLAVLLAVAAVALAIWAGRTFLRAGTPVRPFRTACLMVAHGPYRFTRNPMYLGLVLLLAGLACWLGTPLPPLVIPAFIWLITRDFIRPEEHMLHQRFGDAYLAYCARVRRWI
jgi:protein-S-isoprenylcysteine O-methyltransferase Ste14